MKYIQKREEPPEIAAWKESYREFDGTPSYGDLRSDLKNLIKQSLIDEQGKICCYCGMKVTLQNTHVEHLKPQSDFPEHQVDYSNLLASCEGENRLEHCGHNKHNWYEEDKFVTPLNPECEQFFSFTYDGRMLPSVDDSTRQEMARTTIEKLGLDTKKLNALRKAAIDEILYLEDLTVAEMEQFILQCDTPDEEGQLQSFASAVKYVLQMEKDRYHQQ